MDWASIVLRLLIYLQSGLLLGVLLFAAPWTMRTKCAVMAIALIGIVLCLLSLMLLGYTFADDGGPPNWPFILTILTETAAGWGMIARISTLIALVAVVYADRFRSLAAIFGAVSTATLVWNGHGAMSEGASGWVHLGSDAVHLVAGLSWIGAVAAFLWAAVLSPERDPELQSRLERFSLTGTILVATLLITGVANTLFILGWDGLSMLPATVYGRILLFKVILFVVMLAAAAANRFWLTPRLNSARAIGALRASLSIELMLGVTVLTCVAWLGTLDPMQ